MRTDDFGRWTSSGARRRRRHSARRGLLVACGLAFLAFGLGFLVLELRVPGSDAASPARTAALRLTVPGMQRVDGIPVATAPADDEAALRRGAVRLAGTGLPWQRGSNVYISGHRLGYPGTGSFLVFRDLNRLRQGDEVRLRDGEGRRYSYRVFDRRVVGPGNLSVTEPVGGRRIVSLQTCTLPDYTRRLVVRAELVETDRTA